MKGAQARARKKNIPFDLDFEWVFSRLSAGICEVSGISFVLPDNGNRHAFAPTIDQVIPSAGYTKDNCQLVVWTYNAAKGCSSHVEVLTLAEALCNQTR